MAGHDASDVVGERVRAARRRQGLTVAELARRCAEAGAADLTEQGLYNLEAGRRDKQGRRRRAVTVDELLALARVLDVRVAELLPAVQPSTPLAALPDEQRVAAEANAAQAAPGLAAEVARLLTEGRPIDPRWVAEASYRLREALNALLIGEWN